MLAVIVAVLLEPLLSVRVNVAELDDAFCAIVTLAGELEPWPLNAALAVMLLPVVLLTGLWLASISSTAAVKVPPLPTPLTEQVTAVIVV
jgi:hypothetical protein